MSQSRLSIVLRDIGSGSTEQPARGARGVSTTWVRLSSAVDRIMGERLLAILVESRPGKGGTGALAETSPPKGG